MSEDAKKRLATWNEKDLLEGGKIALEYDKSLNLKAIEIDLADFVGRCNGKWDKFDACLKRTVSNGIKQKISDVVASKGEKAGYSAAERHAIQLENVERVINKLLWDKPAEGGGGKGMAPLYERAIKALTDTAAQITAMANSQPEPIKAAMLASISSLMHEGKTLTEWEEIKTKKLAEKTN